MTAWNQLLAALDKTFGYTNKASSKVKKLREGFDNRTQEQVIWIEYRVKVRDQPAPSIDRSIFGSDREKRIAELMQMIDRMNAR